MLGQCRPQTQAPVDVLQVLVISSICACEIQPAIKLEVDHCQGGDLRKALGRDALEGTREFDWWNRGQDVALSVAQGLHFLHQNGVVHRRD